MPHVGPPASAAGPASVGPASVGPASRASPASVVGPASLLTPASRGCSTAASLRALTSCRTESWESELAQPFCLQQMETSAPAALRLSHVNPDGQSPVFAQITRALGI